VCPRLPGTHGKKVSLCTDNIYGRTPKRHLCACTISRDELKKGRYCAHSIVREALKDIVALHEKYPETHPKPRKCAHAIDRDAPHRRHSCAHAIARDARVNPGLCARTIYIDAPKKQFLFAKAIAADAPNIGLSGHVQCPGTPEKGSTLDPQSPGTHG
jgi:hypothetical protein